MLKIEMKELTAEALIGMREINNQELEEVSGGTECQELQAQGFFIGCYDPLPSLSTKPDWWPGLIG